MNRRRWRAVLAVLALAALGAGAWALSTESLSQDTWARVERRDLVIGVEVEGELQAVESAELGPPQVRSLWDFKLSFMAPEGAEVKAGEPVLGFDTTRLQRSLQEKTAARDSAIKTLEQRATDLEIERRNKVLTLAEAEARLRKAQLKLEVSDQVTSRRELEQARIDHRLASLEIEHLLSGLEHLAVRGAADLAALTGMRDRAAVKVVELEAQVQAMTVQAPRAGTVIYKADWQGNKKKVGDNCWRAETVLQIPDLERMLGEGEVAEADAGRLAAGQRVTLRLDAHPDRQYRATVQKIRRTVQRKSKSNPRKVMRLVLELEETDTERMRPGMRFRGEIEVERVAGTLVVPQEAVVAGPEGAAVVVRSLFGRREVFPAFGERNAELFAVESGLEQGDRVLLWGGGI